MSIGNRSGGGGVLFVNLLVDGHLLAAAARLQRCGLNFGLLGLGAGRSGFLLNNGCAHGVKHHLQTPFGVPQSLSARALHVDLLARFRTVLLGQGVVPLPVKPAVGSGTGGHVVQPV